MLLLLIGLTKAQRHSIHMYTYTMIHFDTFIEGLNAEFQCYIESSVALVVMPECKRILHCYEWRLRLDGLELRFS